MHSPSLLLIIPPLTQLNTPYPSTAYLTGFLRSRGYRVAQADVGIEMVLALFSRAGLTLVFDRISRAQGKLPGEARQMLALRDAYLNTIDALVEFLQGRNPTLAPLICQGRFLPQGPRFAAAGGADLGSSAHSMDQAKRWATMYLEDLADLVQATVAPQFALSRYAEQVGTSASSFEQIARALAKPPSLTDQLMLDSLWRHVDEVHPTIVGLTVPFPGNLYGAFRIAQALKAGRPEITIVLGGGYANTELRRLADPRCFDYVDAVTLDDGERPLLCLLEYLSGAREQGLLRRTFLRSGDKVVWQDGAEEPDVTMEAVGTPTYDGLPLDRYISILDTLNPMHRLWSDGHWNKLTVAHGCYWKQCTFCDVGLDYIGRYEAAPSAILADRIEALIAETGKRGFHFVDEAAPPAGLKGLALTLLERGQTISWWGNIRFEEAFTPDLCRLLAASGCIAVSAGLEAASDRLLAEMKKGITVDQTARVAVAFHEAGILVHAYLMYGLPGETVQETVESLERVRQLFAQGLIQSAFWHKFTATAHSPIGLAPAAHGIRVTGPRFDGFAENDLTHRDPHGSAPDWLGAGLRRATLNFIEGKGLTANVQSWFDKSVEKPKVRRNWASLALAGRAREDDPTAERRIVWTGGTPAVETLRGTSRRVILPGRTDDAELRLEAEKAAWLVGLIREATPARNKQGEGYPSLKDVRAAYPLGGPRAFDALLRSAAWRQARAIGLLLV
ncbi:MAG: B12-binding domain-containing radical SAM protein [Nitrospirae bacterium]|nr:MAG: B12-binding domain-containing radical SAM protein [Nitrospirota bacterium]